MAQLCNGLKNELLNFSYEGAIAILVPIIKKITIC